MTIEYDSIQSDKIRQKVRQDDYRMNPSRLITNISIGNFQSLPIILEAESKCLTQSENSEIGVDLSTFTDGFDILNIQILYVTKMKKKALMVDLLLL